MSDPGPAVVGRPGPAGDRARWDGRYRERELAEPAASSTLAPEPPRPLLRLASLLPPGGRVVDLAGGDGGGALFLARRGLDAVVADISPVALDRAAAFAGRHQLPIRTVEVDLRQARLATILAAVGPPTPAALTCFNYLDRVLLASVADDLPSGSRFLAAIATTTNLERSERPSERFLLRPGELASLVVGPEPSRLLVRHRREGWADGRHVAELVVEAR